MFHFPTFPPHALYIQAQVTGHDSSWVSPFGNPRITVRLPTPRGLSQATTSFFGSWCQGIHRMHLKTCHKDLLKDARVHCAVLKLRAVPPFPGAYPATAKRFLRSRWSDAPTSRSARGPGSRPFPQDPTACLARLPCSGSDPEGCTGNTKTPSNWSMFHP